MIINRANLQDMFRGFQLSFQGALEQAQPMHGQFVTEVPSTKSEEKYGWLGNIAGFRKWVGDRVFHSLSTSDFTIKNEPFEQSFEVDRDDIEDDSYGVYTPSAQMAGYDSAVHPSVLLFQMMKDGFSSFCYDGQYFFDTDHPVAAADGTMTTWSNFGGGSGLPWFLLDCSRPIRPFILQKRRPYQFVAMTSLDDEAVFTRKKFRFGTDARLAVGYGLPQLAYASKQALDVNSYAAAQAGMGSLKGDFGKALALRGTHLLVPPAYEKAAKEAVTAARLANGQDNVMANTATVVVVPWLA